MVPIFQRGKDWEDFFFRTVWGDFFFWNLRRFLFYWKIFCLEPEIPAIFLKENRFPVCFVSQNSQNFLSSLRSMKNAHIFMEKNTFFSINGKMFFSINTLPGRRKVQLLDLKKSWAVQKKLNCPVRKKKVELSKKKLNCPVREKKHFSKRAAPCWHF